MLRAARGREFSDGDETGAASSHPDKAIPRMRRPEGRVLNGQRGTAESSPGSLPHRWGPSVTYATSVSRG